MNQTYNWQSLRQKCLGQSLFSSKIRNWITQENLWNIWVPKTHGGLELSLTEGLFKLKELAQIDGSLGWTITLCSGANYFIGNLPKVTADQIFKTSTTSPILGGSGGLLGTAEKIGENYRISGTWKYGTGAPYLTHFTVNAKLIKDDKEILDKNGSPTFRSFVIPKDDVTIIDDWDTMGLKATATCSFSVDKAIVSKNSSFIYNTFYLPHDIYKINFRVFADLTLWVNYIGMAAHYLEEAQKTLKEEKLLIFKQTLEKANELVFDFANNVTEQIKNGIEVSADYIDTIHQSASQSIQSISNAIIALHPLLGVKAASTNHPLNQIFCDYFTATQHHNFTK